MTPTEWAGLAVAIFTLIAGFAGAVRWMVKHYLYELRPNGGSSLKDKIDLLEEKEKNEKLKEFKNFLKRGFMKFLFSKKKILIQY